MILAVKNWVVQLIRQVWRPSSYPYITGDGFRKIADHIYDETQKCDPAKIKGKDIVFVKSDILDEYFKNCHSKIKYPYKLITHNSDKNITEKELDYIDDKIIHWFAQNVLTKHPKLTPLPIGLENKHYYFNGIPRLFNKFRKQIITKKPRILFGFSVATNKSERQEALAELKSSLITNEITGFPLPHQYLKILNAYQFVASPSGNGLDCHRTWEAMYLKTIPIVKRSPATEFWANLGLSLFPIDDWSSLAKIDEQELNHIYQEITSKARFELLFMDYWFSLIKK